jgi:hypothetical protein
MRKFTIVCCLFLLTPALALRAGAQDTAKAPETPKAPEPPAHYYHLEYVIQELGGDGKPTNSRTYSTIVSTDRTQHFSAIRTGSRVPIVTGALHGPTGEAKEAQLEYQYQYLDVGVSIDAESVREVGNQLAIWLKAEVSSLADAPPPTGSVSGMVNDPVIRQNMWQSQVVIPVGKPTVVFSSDALENKGAMHLVVTATPLQ